MPAPERRRPAPLVRPYRPADMSACLAVFQTNVPKFFIDAERPELVAYLEALPGPYLVLEDPAAGRILGCGGWAVAAADGRADLCWGMVRSELHGTGLGKLLLEARLAGIRRDPAARYVALNTSQHTRGFYERVGFRTLEVVEDGYSPGLDRCEMRLDLGGGA